MKKFFVVFVSLSLVFALCACDANVVGALSADSEAPAATQTIAPGAALLPVSTPAATPAPTPAATAVVAPAPPSNWQIDRAETPSDYQYGRPFHWKQIVEDSPFQLDQNGRTVEFGTYPQIDGSTVAIPMAQEFARQHLNLPHPDGFVRFNKTHTAYENLIFNQNTAADENAYSRSAVAMTDLSNGEQETVYLEQTGTDLIIATYPSDEELQLAADNGAELVIEPVCRDAFVFITYKDNPVDSLTVGQIRDIYAGRITNWAEVGGDNLPIRAFSRNPNSGSQTAMENLVMQGTPIADSIVSEDTIDGMSTLVSEVGYQRDDGGSLGYTYQYFLFQDMGEGQYYSPAEEVKVLGVNGVIPTPGHIADKSYPFSVNYYGVIRKGDEGAPGGKFLDWMRSEEGQACIKQIGYIALDGSYADFYFGEDGFVFPDSSQRALSEADFDHIKKYVYTNYGEQVRKLLAYARNEIFARHGNEFTTPLYAAHYSQYDWYNSLPRHKVELGELNPTEQANVKLIRQWEQEWAAQYPEEPSAD